MGLFHPIRRINPVIRGNLFPLRQIESELLPALAYSAVAWQIDDMTQPDPLLAAIAAEFKRFDVEKSRGAYMIVDRRTSDPIARLRPIPNTDRFELFYWSNTDGRWRTFGNFGRMKLLLERAREIVENDPMYRVPRAR